MSILSIDPVFVLATVTIPLATLKFDTLLCVTLKVVFTDKSAMFSKGLVASPPPPPSSSSPSSTAPTKGTPFSRICLTFSISLVSLPLMSTVNLGLSNPCSDLNFLYLLLPPLSILKYLLCL